MNKIINDIENIFNQYAPCVYIEVLESSRGTPCKAGFKMIVDRNGRLDGSVGGGILENTCITIAKQMIEKNEKIRIERFSLTDDASFKTEKINQQKGNENIQVKNQDKKGNDENEKKVLYAACGGDVTLFFELFSVSSLYIFGAGHIGQNLVNIMNGLGYRIKLFDVREDILENLDILNFKNNIFGNNDNNLNKDNNLNNYNNLNNHNNLDNGNKLNNGNKSNIEFYKLIPIEKDEKQDFLVEDKQKNVQIPLSHYLQDESFIIITTHGHAYDFSIAKYILNLDKNFKYIGMVGSKNKVKDFCEKLKEKNFLLYKKLMSSNFYSPIGLDIGGVSAKEIALSIAAQIQSVRYDKKNNDLSIIKNFDSSIENQ